GDAQAAETAEDENPRPDQEDDGADRRLLRRPAPGAGLVLVVLVVEAARPGGRLLARPFRAPLRNGLLFPRRRAPRAGRFLLRRGARPFVGYADDPLTPGTASLAARRVIADPHPGVATGAPELDGHDGCPPLPACEAGDIVARSGRSRGGRR